MPKSFYACLSAVLVLVMLAFAYGEADAARIGGGRSVHEPALHETAAL